MVSFNYDNHMVPFTMTVTYDLAEQLSYGKETDLGNREETTR